MLSGVSADPDQRKGCEAKKKGFYQSPGEFISVYGASLKDPDNIP